ncbi:Hsp70 family protein [Aspergillus lucknowensis]|uniref:Uncharacterized protein n=1 Tax=Aspergillus lucknowensis TaxID=176173 RepID=A0ABR4M064_9EURO
MSYSGETQKWGYQVEVQREAACSSRFKLSLDTEADPTKFDDGLLSATMGTGILTVPEGKTAELVTEDYFRAVYSHILRIFETELKGCPLPSITFYISVPAVWSERAKQATMLAATSAGFGSREGDAVELIREPEAGLCYSLEFGGLRLQQGQGVLVADLGGGTVDVALYLVQNLEPALQVHPLVAMQGAKCGGTAIDRLFIEMLNERYGEEFKQLPQAAKGPRSVLFQDFERNKRKFTGLGQRRDRTLRLCRATDPWLNRMDETVIRLSDAQLHQLFHGVVQKIAQLINSQIEAAREASGGHPVIKASERDPFCRYLRTVFEGPSNVSIIVPPNPQMAVVIGGALRALAFQPPQSLKAPLNYGFETPRPLRPNRDPPEVGSYGRIDGEGIVYGAISWVMRNGVPYYHPWHTATEILALIPEHGMFRLPVLACSQDVPPEFTSHRDVHQITGILVQIQNIGSAGHAREIGNGFPMYQVQLVIRTAIDEHLQNIQFVVLHQGVEVGRHALCVQDVDLSRPPQLF